MDEIALCTIPFERIGSVNPCDQPAKIMIVDDDPDTVDVVQDQLSSIGYRDLVTCTEAKAALSVIEREDPDVLLLDIVMPEINGLAILKRIRDSVELAHLPVIILTAIDDIGTRIRALELGASDFVSKPVDFVELIPRIRNALLVKVYHDQLRRHAEELQRQVELQTSSLKESHATLEQANLVLRRSCEAAEAATRAKSEFLANISHEIRTPLTAIIGFAEELLDEPSCAACSQKKPERAAMLDTILRNGRHLLQIVNDVLDVARIEKGRLAIERVPCSPQAIVDAVKCLMEPRAAAKGLELLAETRGPVPALIHSDPTRLQQILTNLVGNAIKFTRTGSVRIVMEILGGESPSPVLQFEVIDTGVGLEQSELGEIFKPFTQAKTSNAAKYGGVGLGLTICRYLAEELGGAIQVESQPGVGSTFRVTVAGIAPPDDDATDSPRPTAHEGSAAAPQEIPSGCRVLLAEDSTDNQRLIKLILEKRGAVVTLAGDGLAAFEMAIDAWNRGAPFDVILTDIQMPRLNGYDLIARLRAAHYGGPIIALTANAMTGEREKCMATGCDDYLSKPISREGLIAVVARYARKDAAQ